MAAQGTEMLEPNLASQLELDRITFDPAVDAPLFQRHALGVRVFNPVQWPQGLAPAVQDVTASPDDPLPEADVLIVTYTMAEGYALADVLTPGVKSTQWNPDRNGWPEIRAMIEGPRAPSLRADCAGYWAVTKIGDVTAVLVKSELHPATDGPKLPIVAAWKKWVGQVKPKLVLTTGTAGAVQHDTLLGDVVVTGHVSWDCTQRFKNQSFADAKYVSPLQPEDAWFDAALPLIATTAAALPTRPRAPQIWTDAHTISTDHFAFDDVENRYGLQTFDPNARAVEMDDAACAEALTDTDIAWLSVRNASDPQMDNPTLAQEAKLAASIYNRFGQVSSWGSAIACWAIVCAVGGKDAEPAPDPAPEAQSAQ